MDRQKSRKSHESRRLTCDGVDFSINGRDYNEKSKYKKHLHSDKKKHETSPNSYLLNWSPLGRMHSINQRQFPTSESSPCHYSVPLSLSFEPFSLPIYPALIQPQANCTVPLEVENHSGRPKHHKSYSRRRQNKSSSMEQNDTPAIFQTPRINTGDQQDYTSLPHVNCDLYTTAANDQEPANRRRFSDPGLGQMSSDECSSSRSDSSNSRTGTPDIQPHDFYSLAEQVIELKESNSHLKKELQETKLELETIKCQNWKISCDDFKPGALSDAISEIRSAVKLGEEALISRVLQMLEKNSAEFKEAQVKLEERLREEMNERLLKLEEQLSTGATLQETNSETSNPDVSKQSPRDSEVQEQIVKLEQKKFELEKELQEAVTKQRIAEASTEKLERLVAILRKKINGVSLESCIPDEKQFFVRPLASSLEKNPFIIANNKQGQKADTLPFCKPKVSTFIPYPGDSTNEGLTSTKNEHKENETGVSNGNTGSNSTPETPPVTAQVTITGPVTDL